MREVKFRAWNKIQKEYIYFNITDMFCDRYGIFVLEDLSNFTFNQFTGLKDKNGKDIYEGDILECSDLSFPFEGRKNIKGVVVYDDNSFCLKIDNVFNNLFTNAEVIEIIGNINENKELLKQ